MNQRRGRIAASHWPRPASRTTAESALRRDAALRPVPPAGGAALRRQRWGAATPAAPLQWKKGRGSEGEEAAGEGGTIGVHTERLLCACIPPHASARAGIRARKASARAQRLVFAKRKASLCAQSAKAARLCVRAGRLVHLLSRKASAWTQSAKRVLAHTEWQSAPAFVALYNVRASFRTTESSRTHARARKLARKRAQAASAYAST